MGRYLTCEDLDRFYKEMHPPVNSFLFSITEYNLKMLEEISNTLCPSASSASSISKKINRAYWTLIDFQQNMSNITLLNHAVKLLREVILPQYDSSHTTKKEPKKPDKDSLRYLYIQNEETEESADE